MAIGGVGSTFIFEIEQTTQGSQTNTADVGHIMFAGLDVAGIQIEVITNGAGNCDVQFGDDEAGYLTMLQSVQTTANVGVFWQDLTVYALDRQSNVRVVTTGNTKVNVRFFCTQFSLRTFDVTTT